MSRRIRRSAWLIAAAFVLPMSPVNACADLVVQAGQQGDTVYDPNERAPIRTQIELSVPDNPTERSCLNSRVELVSLSAGDVQSFRFSNSTMNSELPSVNAGLAERKGGSLVLTPQAVRRLLSDGRLVLDIAQFAAGNFAAPGMYTNQLEVRVDGRTVSQLQTELTVLPAMRLIGAPDNGRTNLDFGTLQSNDQVASSFVYQSNAAVTVKARSESGVGLVHERGEAVGIIPYQTFLDGKAIASDGLQSVTLTKNGSGIQRIGNLMVQVGDIGSPPAGHYSDLLTLSFSAY